MNKDSLVKFKKLLMQKHDLLMGLQATGQSAAETVELDQTKVGRLSRMDAMQMQAMSQESNRRRSLELKNIAAAMMRIQQGKYGYCLSCDEKIMLKRLEISPETPYCIGCAENLNN